MAKNRNVVKQIKLHDEGTQRNDAREEQPVAASSGRPDWGSYPHLTLLVWEPTLQLTEPPDQGHMHLFKNANIVFREPHAIIIPNQSSKHPGYEEQHQRLKRTWSK